MEKTQDLRHQLTGALLSFPIIPLDSAPVLPPIWLAKVAIVFWPWLFLLGFVEFFIYLWYKKQEDITD